MNHLHSGLILTPRGLYGLIPVIPSDQFPQGAMVVPLTDIYEDSKNLDTNLMVSLRHSVIEMDRDKDEGTKRIMSSSIKGNYEKKWNHPPYQALLNTKKEKLLVWYDPNGEIKYATPYDQENLGVLINADMCSDLFIWNHQGLTEKELLEIKVHLLDERDRKILTPTKKDGNNTGWEFEMPEIGPVVIVLVDDSKINDGRLLIIVRKKADIGKF